MTKSDSISAGIHLPQAGPAASGEALRRAAEVAEQLGYADVWLSDHLVVPTGIDYPPSPYVFETLTSMAWVAAATSRVRIGTTVLVMPMRNPLMVAKAVASVDQLSGGRVILGTAGGWLKEEFLALGVPFEERGKRTDEAIEILRRLWTDDHITANYPVHGIQFKSIRAKPQPVGHLPIWIGGHSDLAVERAIRVGDGWHGAFAKPDVVAKIVSKIRAGRPEPEFPISMRVGWDPLEDDDDTIRSEFDQYVEAGVQHFVPEPRQRTLDAYLSSMEQLTKLLSASGVTFSEA